MTYDQLYCSAPLTRVTLGPAYTTVDLSAIWESEILPLLTPDLVALHGDAVSAFVFEVGYHVEGKPQVLNFNEQTHGCARVHTRHSGFWDEIEEAIEAAAAERGCKRAKRHQSLSRKLWTKNDKPSKHFDKYDAEMAEIAKSFYPKRTCPEYWAPMASCHWVNLWALEVAKRWRPEGRWKVKRTEGHTVAVDTKNKLVFDLLLYRGGLDVINETLKPKLRG